MSDIFIIGGVKIRIKKIGSRFYIQHKGRFFWHDIYDQYGLFFRGPSLSFKTRKEAEERVKEVSFEHTLNSKEGEGK
ncbi:hypothetical protein [Litorimonas sp.]|uniref:hypothetical protein n=1 Tax=Litorimonas sp. TaxID=1892381 RepID=UPI003A8BB42C